jgi:hypothetical protein
MVPWMLGIILITEGYTQLTIQTSTAKQNRSSSILYHSQFNADIKYGSRVHKIFARPLLTSSDIWFPDINFPAVSGPYIFAVHFQGGELLIYTAPHQNLYKTYFFL